MIVSQVRDGMNCESPVPKKVPAAPNRCLISGRIAIGTVLLIFCGKGITTTLCAVAGRKETGIGNEDWKRDRWPAIDGCSPTHRSTNRSLINNKINSVNGAHPTNLDLALSPRLSNSVFLVLSLKT